MFLAGDITAQAYLTVELLTGHNTWSGVKNTNLELLHDLLELTI